MLRWLALAAFAGCLGISSYYRWRARRRSETIARRREGATLLAGRGLVALPLFGSVISYLLNPAWMEWASFAAPSWLRWAGAATALLGIAGTPEGIIAACAMKCTGGVIQGCSRALVTKSQCNRRRRMVGRRTFHEH